MPKLSPATQKIRAKKLVKDLNDANGNMSAVARKQHRSPQAISEQLQRPYVKQYMGEILDKAGVSDEIIARTIKAGLKAKETKFFQHEGVVVEEREVIDYSERREHAKLAAQLKGHLAPDPKSGPNITWIQILNDIKSIQIPYADLISSIESKLTNQIP